MNVKQIVIIIIAFVLSGCSITTNPWPYTSTPGPVSLPPPPIWTDEPTVTVTQSPSETATPSIWEVTPTPDSIGTEEALTPLGGDWATAYPKFGETGLLVSGLDIHAVYRPYYTLNVRRCAERYFENGGRLVTASCPVVLQVTTSSHVGITVKLMIQSLYDDFAWSEWLCLFNADYFCQDVVIYRDEGGQVYGALTVYEER